MAGSEPGRELIRLYRLIMAGPMLNFKNEEKMHISKGPGVRSWGILIGKFDFCFFFGCLPCV